MGTPSAKSHLQSDKQPGRVLWYLALYLAVYLVLSSVQPYQPGNLLNTIWMPSSGLSLIIGFYAYPFSIPIIWLASLLETLFIHHQPLESITLMQITLYACVYGALPALLDKRGERFKGIQTLFHTVQLILLCVITATAIAIGTTLIGSLSYPTDMPHYQRYVKTFLQEFFGGYSVSFVYLSLASTLNHINRKMDFKNPHAQTKPFPIHISKSSLLEGVSLILVLVLGILFFQALPERRLLNYAILILLPTTWLAFRFGTTGTMLGLPIVMILAQAAQTYGQLDLVRAFELVVTCSIYTIMLTMLGTTVLVQRRSDLHLAASKNKFDLLAETSPVGICQINQYRELEYTNPRWIELTGLNTDRTHGADFLDFIHPSDHSEIISALAYVQSSQLPKEITFRVQRPDRCYLWLQGSLSLLEDPVSHELGTLLTVIDVTTIKTEEEKLKGKESLLLAFVNGITDPAWMKDTEGRYLAMNEVMEKLHDVKREDILGKTDFEIWDKQTAEKFTSTDKQVMETGTPLRFESQLAPDMPDRWYETVKSPILINDQIYGTTGISREITERRTMVNALRESEHRLDALLNNIPDLAWMKDKNKNYLAVNGIFCTTFRVEGDEVVGSTGQNIFPEKTIQMLDQSDDEVLILGRPKVVESVYIDGSGFETWYETIKMPLFDEKSLVVGLTGVARDITNRKRAEEAFQYRLDTEKLISQISTRLNRIQFEDCEQEIDRIIEQVARFIHADRSYFIQFGEDHRSIQHVYGWHDDGIEDRQHYIFGDTWNELTWLNTQLKAAKPVTINRILDLPASARNEMELALKENITSIMLIPVSVQDNIFNSLLTAESVTNVRNWSSSEEQLLKVISEMISITLSRLSSEDRLRRAETRYRMLAEQISAVVYIDAFDEFSTGEYMSPQIEDLIGYTSKEILANDALYWQLIHPDDLENVLAENRRTNQTRDPFQAEYRLVKKTGEVVWVEDKALIFQDENGLEHWFGVIYDITNRKQIEEALQISQARFQDLFNHSPVALWEEDFSKVKIRLDELRHQGISDFREYFKYHPKEVTNLIGLIEVVDVNEASLELTNTRSKAELLEMHNHSRYQKPNDLFTEEMIHLANGEIDFEIEGANDIKDGEVRYHQVSVMVVPGHEKAYERVIIAVTDVTERKSTEEKLIFLSTHDSLTGLYSRSYFETEMERLQVSRQYPISLIMADIDYLKETNDQLGHAAGDQLITLAAQVLRMAFRPEDIIARIGGDEFAILIPKTDVDAAAQMVQRLRNLIDAENQKTDRVIPFDLSIGIATAVNGESLSESLKEADHMMYENKTSHHKKI